jgi:hypothetical protein
MRDCLFAGVLNGSGTVNIVLKCLSGTNPSQQGLRLVYVINKDVAEWCELLSQSISNHELSGQEMLTQITVTSAPILNLISEPPPAATCSVSTTSVSQTFQFAAQKVNITTFTAVSSGLICSTTPGE